MGTSLRFGFVHMLLLQPLLLLLLHLFPLLLGERFAETEALRCCNTVQLRVSIFGRIIDGDGSNG